MRPTPILTRQIILQGDQGSRAAASGSGQPQPPQRFGYFPDSLITTLFIMAMYYMYPILVRLRILVCCCSWCVYSHHSHVENIFNNSSRYCLKFPQDYFLHLDPIFIFSNTIKQANMTFLMYTHQTYTLELAPPD